MEYDTLRILICGGRNFGNLDREFETQEEYAQAWNEMCFIEEKLVDLSVNKRDELLIIQGEAKGVDYCAKSWAKLYGIPCAGYKADWEKYGKSAGFIRNKQMLNEGKPDLVVAFPGGKGTKMMVELAKKAGVKVIEYEVNQR